MSAWLSDFCVGNMRPLPRPEGRRPIRVRNSNWLTSPQDLELFRNKATNRAVSVSRERVVRSAIKCSQQSLVSCKQTQ